MLEALYLMDRNESKTGILQSPSRALSMNGNSLKFQDLPIASQVQGKHSTHRSLGTGHARLDPKYNRGAIRFNLSSAQYLLLFFFRYLFVCLCVCVSVEHLCMNTSPYACAWRSDESIACPVPLRQRLSLSPEQAFSQPDLKFASSSAPPVSAPTKLALQACTGCWLIMLVPVHPQHSMTSLQPSSTTHDITPAILSIP